MKIQNYALLLESKSFFNDLVFPRIQEGGQLEENYDAIVSNFKEQNEALKNKNNILEEKVELMTQYQSLARDNEAGEKEQIQLLLEKIRFANSVTIESLIFFSGCWKRNAMDLENELLISKQSNPQEAILLNRSLSNFMKLWHPTLKRRMSAKNCMWR